MRKRGFTSRRLDALRILLLTLAAALHALLALAIARHWPTDKILRRDYWVFWDAGRRFVEGQLAGIYDARPGGFPFLHPPPVIVLSAPFGHFSPRAVYAFVLGSSAVLLATSALALRMIGTRRHEQDLVWLVLATSAPWAIALLVGQPVALFLFAWMAGIAALERGRPATAGLLLGPLWLKPQFALGALVLGVRSPRLANGMLAAALALFLVSLPAGFERWPEWLSAITRAGGEVGTARILLWKQHTLLAFLRGLVPSGSLAFGFYLFVALPLALGTLRSLREGSALRAGSLLVLTTLALSPYAYYYDAVLLAVPLAHLWLERDRYGGFRIRLALAAATFTIQHIAFFALQRGPPFGGLMLTLWLAAELFFGRMDKDTRTSVEKAPRRLRSGSS